MQVEHKQPPFLKVVGALHSIGDKMTVTPNDKIMKSLAFLPFQLSNYCRKYHSLNPFTLDTILKEYKISACSQKKNHWRHHHRSDHRSSSFAP
jgi:hypothetical protein